MKQLKRNKEQKQLYFKYFILLFKIICGKCGKKRSDIGEQRFKNLSFQEMILFSKFAITLTFLSPSFLFLSWKYKKKLIKTNKIHEDNFILFGSVAVLDLLSMFC